jgi:exodeoxyribonuclease VII small subunit
MTDSPPTASRPPLSEAESAQTAPSPTEPPQTYEAAAARVEEIIRRLDSGDASLNETLALVAEGKGLIELCARELAAVGDALEELRLDELVSRLEGETAGREAGSSGSGAQPAPSPEGPAGDLTEADER